MVMQLLGILLIAVVSVSSTAYGQVGVKTDFGFDGYYYPDLPTPLSIRIKNEGSPLRGQLIIGQEVRSPWEGTVEERLLIPFELAGRSEKLLQLNFPVHGYIYPLSISIVAGGRNIYKEEIELKRRSLEERLTLAISDALFPGELPTGERPLQVEPESLPPEWPGLLGVRRVYLGRFDPSSLSPEQWQALVQWLERGGGLVILGGDNWYLQDSPRLREILPFKPQDIGQWAGRPIVLGELRGEVLYRQEDLPILIAGQRGRGRVVFSTINPLNSSIGEGFWERLREGVGEGPDLDKERLQLAAELLGRLRLPFPSKFTLIGIYSLYLGGLALFGWLSLHRQRLVILLLFWIAGASGLAARYIDRPEFVKLLMGLELSLAHDLGETTLHSAWHGLFARADGELRLPIDIGEGYLVQAIPEERGDHLYDADYLLEWGKTVVSFKARKWQGRAFYLQRFSRDLAGLEVAGGRVIIKNRNSYPLRDCTLFDKGSGKLHLVGDIGPQEAIEREVEPEAGLPQEPLLARLYSLARGEVVGQWALLCTIEPGEFPSLSTEERITVGLALIEEDR